MKVVGNMKLLREEKNLPEEQAHQTGEQGENSEGGQPRSLT
jgi:hypothetical protein